MTAATLHVGDYLADPRRFILLPTRSRTEMKVRRGPTYSPAVPSPTTFSRGRPPVTNPFDLPSRLREGNGLLLSGSMNGARRRLEELARVYADRSTAPPAALDHHNWRQHCGGLFQIPIAA
jgi:hypothetical protein